MIGDTVGHDKMCGHYCCYSDKVQQNCRYCEVPTADSDNHEADYPLRCRSRVLHLMANGSDEELQAKSQYRITNAFYELRFGYHHTRSIHGSTPAEILHQFQKGIMERIHGVFFSTDIINEGTVTAFALDIISARIGRRTKHQSDRDLPRLYFPKGLTKNSRLTAAEFSGLLLLLLMVLLNKDARDAIRRTHGKKDKLTDNFIIDYIALLENILQMEAWLKSPSLAVREVRKAKSTIRWIMECITRTAARSKGMGWKLPKFHFLLHMIDDLLDNGVAQNFNSGPCESTHIELIKRPSKNTQHHRANLPSRDAVL